MRLKSLDFSHCFSLSQDHISLVSELCHTNLTSLTLDHTSPPPGFVAELRFCSNLTTLKLAGCSTVTDHDIDQLTCTLKGMRKLDFVRVCYFFYEFSWNFNFNF